jgi:transcription elongation factor GreB
VQIELEDGGLRWYRLVGPDEFDMASDYVSMDSPLGKSLLGKRLDDEITVTLPSGSQTITVVAIHYAAASERPDAGGPGAAG